jgi:predicted ATPase
MNTLQCNAHESKELAELIHRKTGGNPFFVIQFFKNLYERKIVVLNSQGQWEWDINKINTMQVTDNVVEFMADKITRLPNEAQDILKICACIGDWFDLETLSIVSEKSIEKTLTDLTFAVREDMVRLQGDIYTFHENALQNWQ